MNKKLVILILITGVLGGALYWLSYETLRAQNMQVQLLFLIAFLIYGWGIIRLKKGWKAQLMHLFTAGLVLRVLLLFSIPNLSDDFYRFTWDGYLVVNGVNPFDWTPEEYVEAHPEDTLAVELFHAHSENFKTGMNSKRFFSIYPTINQSIYAVSYWLSESPNQGNLLIMKCFMLIFEVVSFFLIVRLLRAHKKDPFWTYVYWLNPMVIIEFVGNLHFEGIALTFLLASFALLLKQKYLSSGLALAAAICTKINPIFLACISWREVKWKSLLKWWTVTGIVTIGLLVFFLNLDNIGNFQRSFRLYFYVFEFNDSFLRLGAYLGELINGKTALAFFMAILPPLTIIGILSLNLFKRFTISEKLMLAYFIYLLLGTTVHPWYVLMLVPFAILSDWKFPLVWSYVSVWTYYFYHFNGVKQEGWMIALEYSVVFIFLYLDLKKKSPKLKPANYE